MTVRSDYLRDALDVRRLIRAHRFDDTRLTQDIEVCYFFDASVLIDMATIDKLAHVTNLFNLCPPERLDAFFKMRKMDEIGADATAVIVGAFETFNYLVSRRLPSQNPDVILQTEEHRFEVGNYGAYLHQRIDDHIRKHLKAAGDEDEADAIESEETRADPGKFEARLEKQFGEVDDGELLKLFLDAAAMERLTRLQQMKLLLTENTATGLRLEPPGDIQEAVRRRIVAIRPHQQKNADRDAKSLAKLIALQRRWFDEKSRRRCIFVTNDHAIHRVYREFFFKGFAADHDLGKIEAERLRCGDNPDDWYILRDPAQYAAVLNTREIKALADAGAEPQLDQRVLRDLGDATYAVLSASPIRVRDENGNEAQREYRENGAFEDNVDRDYSFGNVLASGNARARLYPNWRSAMLTSVAINSNTANLGDILDDMNRWVGKASTQKQLLKHIRAAADGALLTHAMFALETVREFRSDRTQSDAPLRALVIRVNTKNYTLDPDKLFTGRMDEFFGATTECLAHDAWAPAMFFARSARSKCEREGASADVMQEALYLFSLAARLGVTRARDLVEALAAIDKAVELSKDADVGYGFRARSEQLSVQMTQWLHGVNANEPWWPAPLRLPGVQLADFLKHIGADFPQTAQKRLKQELTLLQGTRGGQWRNDVKRHLSVNLYIAQVLSCDPQKVAKLKDADAAVDEYLNGDQPLLLSTVRHVARYVVNRNDKTAADLLRSDLAALRSISLEQPRQRANRTDRLLIEFLCKRYDIKV